MGFQNPDEVWDNGERVYKAQTLTRGPRSLPHLHEVTQPSPVLTGRNNGKLLITHGKEFRTKCWVLAEHIAS